QPSHCCRRPEPCSTDYYDRCGHHRCDDSARPGACRPIQLRVSAHVDCCHRRADCFDLNHLGDCPGLVSNDRRHRAAEQSASSPAGTRGAERLESCRQRPQGLLFRPVPTVTWRDMSNKGPTNGDDQDPMSEMFRKMFGENAPDPEEIQRAMNQFGASGMPFDPSMMDPQMMQ